MHNIVSTLYRTMMIAVSIIILVCVFFGGVFSSSSTDFNKMSKLLGTGK